MNKIIFALFLSVCYTSFMSAQDDEKVKGDRNVTIKQTYIDPFNKIVVGEDFYVEVIYNKRPSVEVEADDNLHEFISFEVKDSVLSFSTTKKIVSRKKMSVKVNYGDELQHIETHEDAEIRSLTSLEFKNSTLKTTGTSKAYLNIKAESFKFEGQDKAKVKLNVNAKNSNLILSDNSKLDALINAPETTFDLLIWLARTSSAVTAPSLVVRSQKEPKSPSSTMLPFASSAGVCESLLARLFTTKDFIA